VEAWEVGGRVGVEERLEGWKKCWRKLYRMVREGVRAGRHEEVRGERRQAWLIEERRKMCESLKKMRGTWVQLE
jgi:hypothetical protein